MVHFLQNNDDGDRKVDLCTILTPFDLLNSYKAVTLTYFISSLYMSLLSTEPLVELLKSSILTEYVHAGRRTGIICPIVKDDREQASNHPQIGLISIIFKIMWPVIILLLTEQ